jgi:hypothetical protein
MVPQDSCPNCGKKSTDLIKLKGRRKRVPGFLSSDHGMVCFFCGLSAPWENIVKTKQQEL